ncbi:hypothetical protein [Curtobacterium sp. MCBA15_012]|uniref:hypothetical protein n=1 Tax=Curtobacterium sp. MCBA15_012 TaxID=1898738 RepID=UPI00158728D6|nr:hypothetical protein [Curtobacterium sp. MCBA15_012]WIB00351.1 hypothetical protein QOL15_01285 [Curtobacterium sp. MCBA15_012]
MVLYVVGNVLELAGLRVVPGCSSKKKVAAHTGKFSFHSTAVILSPDTFLSRCLRSK